VVLEKPIGHDTSSSIAINDQITQFFSEEQIYRIDHYLGKEAVLNVLALRFANTLFFENWSNRVIERVEITVAEEIGVEDRWNYYDKYGQIRDMLQNHLLQLLSLMAMEPPSSLSPIDIRYEKLQVLRSLRFITKNNVHEYVIRGQYERALLDTGEERVAYTQENGADKNSQTETFVALKTYIDNERWSGVPFYLLTGKRLLKKCSEVVIFFKPQANSIFSEAQSKGFSNKLIIRLQPNEGIALSITSKTPGFKSLNTLQKKLLDLNFYSGLKKERIVDAYERLLLEIMSGNQNLFVSRQEIEQAWLWIDSIKSSWEEAQLPLLKYPCGTWGPNALKEFFSEQAHIWDEDAVS
jgi:glucose-6-phosphate 1-dehydrogenase